MNTQDILGESFCVDLCFLTLSFGVTLKQVYQTRMESITYYQSIANIKKFQNALE